MSTTSNVHFDISLLNDPFDFSRYPTFKTNLSTAPRGYRCRAHRCTAFAYSNCALPSSRAETGCRSRNASEPQLISSTNYVTDSLFTNLTSASTVGDVADLSIDDEANIFAMIQSSQSTALVAESSSDSSWGVMDDRDPEKTANSMSIHGTSGHIERSDGDGEDSSLYSMDSADRELHPLLLSMPEIPMIKLERKATVRKIESEPVSNPTQNQTLLSPHIRDFKSSARLSARRYGCVLPREQTPSDLIKGYGHTLKASQRLDSASYNQEVGICAAELTTMHCASEPMLHVPYTSDEEESLLKKGAREPARSDSLSSTIDGAELSSALRDDGPEFAVDGSCKLSSKRGHKRSSLTRSTSFSSIFHAIADGCATLDLLFRKQKTVSKKIVKPTLAELSPTSQDPTSKWSTKEGRIAIKVFVPSTEDIWMFRVPQHIDLAGFTSRVVTKLGLEVSFSGSLWDEPKYYFTTDEQFKAWIKGRVRFGRNLPIVAHVNPPPPLVTLSADWDGWKVWYYT